MSASSEKPRKYYIYRLAVPMSDETLARVDVYAEFWSCTRTEAARALLEWAAKQPRLKYD